MLKISRGSFCLKRHLSASSHILEPLPRSLLRVSGPEAKLFLQGLITNDIEHLSSGPGSMYTMFLNNAGRILYDALIYRQHQADQFLIECDKNASEQLQKHLKLYRVRRKISIDSLEEKVFVLFSENGSVSDGPAKCKEHTNFVIYKDPRIAELGYRVITKPEVDVINELKEINLGANLSNANKYKVLRYTLGVGEGVEDLPPRDCFPLECNCDYLHGVSFHKGCYIGQELTARIHHTGVIRKRLMPIFFSKVPRKLPDRIIHENVSLGKLRGFEGNVGLALLRFSKALSFNEFSVGDGIGRTLKPSWWPKEAPKDKAQISQLQ